MAEEREYQPGDEIGGYRLERRLGGGGFGSVWLAAPTAGGDKVALKLLNGRFASADNARLRAEVELLAASASSSSPHVVRVLGGGVEPLPYVVMEYIEGTDLSSELDRRARATPSGAFSQEEVIGIGRAVASALGVLEASGIIHRDVKPANVMIDRAGVVKLADFGIAKIVGFDTVTATSQLPMSMAYAAPEVWEGHANHQSDIYALGCMLYQCLAGRPPFTGSYAEVFRQHLATPPDLSALPPDLAPSLRELVRTSLAKQAAERPAGSQAVLALLARAEAEAATRAPASAAIPAHEPQGFGPWLREAVHPSQSWAFLCRHETTGQRATVEVHFSDDLEHGTRLRKALAANPALVPLGAERLLGTNRLILRPGERWTETPPGAFQFWVAREELPLRPGPSVVTPDLLDRLASQLTALRETARGHGLALALPAEDLALIGAGEALLRRPGLTEGNEDGLSWLGTLPVDPEPQTLVVPVPPFGVAQVSEGTSLHRGAAAGESQLLQAPTVVVPPPPAPIPAADSVEPDTPLVQYALDDPPPPKDPGRRRRVSVGWLGGSGAAALAFAALAAFFLWPDGGSPGGDDEATPTTTPSVTVTSTPTPTASSSASQTPTAEATPTPTATPVSSTATRVSPTATPVPPTATPTKTPTPTPTATATFTPTPPPTSTQATVDVFVSATTYWTDSGIELAPGDHVSISADPNDLWLNDVDKGSWNGPVCVFGPAPAGEQPERPGTYFPAPGLPMWCLVGRIGGGTPFAISAGLSFVADRTGTLALSLNDGGTWNNGDGVTARVTFRK